VSDLFLFDGKYRSSYGSIAGLDEAGRGPLAGPLVACAVILPEDFDDDVLTDSKKLTDRRRRQLKPVIEAAALAVSLGIVTSAEIDAGGMSLAVRTSFRRAMKPLTGSAALFLVDGNGVTSLEAPCRFIVKGDSKSLSIAAASVVAKVARDDMMLELSGKFPGYGFDGHKGYGTAAHIQAIRRLGASPAHRMSFEPLKSMYPTGQLSLFPAVPESRGRAAEGRAAGYYESLGYTVAERNWRCSSGEIDLILVKSGSVVFAEVKSTGSGLEKEALSRIDSRKFRRIMDAASVWMAETGFSGECSFEGVLVASGAIRTFPLRFMPGD